MALQDYARRDGDAPMATRVLGFIAEGDGRTRAETLAAFEPLGTKRTSIDNAVAELCAAGLIRRTGRGVVEADYKRAWEAIAAERKAAGGTLTARILRMIEHEGPCGRNAIIARLQPDGATPGGIDANLK